MVYDERDCLIAVLPAHRIDNRIISHGGLSYGGFLTDRGMTASLMLQIFSKASAFLMDQEIDFVDYRPVPHIYHQCPAEEDLYALFLSGATMYKRVLVSAISRDEAVRPSPGGRRNRRKRKALRLGIEVRESRQWSEYWSLLVRNLRERHQVEPTHSLDEICLLESSFPENIKLFCAYLGSEIQAGVVMYLCPTVGHAQYAATTESGRETGALDLLFSVLIEDTLRHVPYFDFGNSNENRGHFLNRGLIEFKEGFGARAVVQDNYQIDLRSLDLAVFDANARSE